LLAARGGWVALTLARPDDLDLLPAWLGVEGADDVPPAIGGRAVRSGVAAGAELGLAVAGVGRGGAVGGPPVSGGPRRGAGEASRPRALEALGIDAAALVRSGPQVWVSITAYGREGDGRNRVGFGDDVAAAGGAIVEDDGPCFCADALADPLAGMFAAAAVLD